MGRTSRNPARLILALAVASVLAVFLLYTSVAGSSMASVKPSTLTPQAGEVSLTGIVVGKVEGDARSADGMRFRMRDIGSKRGAKSVAVVFRGTVPDLFRTGRHVVVDGELQRGVFVADKLVTKCPSKYAPAAKPGARATAPAERLSGSPERSSASRASSEA